MSHEIEELAGGSKRRVAACLLALILALACILRCDRLALPPLSNDETFS